MKKSCYNDYRFFFYTMFFTLIVTYKVDLRNNIIFTRLAYGKHSHGADKILPYIFLKI